MKEKQIKVNHQTLQVYKRVKHFGLIFPFYYYKTLIIDLILEFF